MSSARHGTRARGATSLLKSVRRRGESGDALQCELLGSGSKYFRPTNYHSTCNHTLRPLVGEINQLLHLIQRHADIGRFFVTQDDGEGIEVAKLVRREWHRDFVLQQQIDKLIHIMRSAKHDAVIFGNRLEGFFQGNYWGRIRNTFQASILPLTA